MKTYKEFSKHNIDEGLGSLVGGALGGLAGDAIKGVGGAALKALFSKAKKGEVTKSPGKMHGADKVT